MYITTDSVQDWVVLNINCIIVRLFRIHLFVTFVFLLSCFKPTQTVHCSMNSRIYCLKQVTSDAETMLPVELIEVTDWLGIVLTESVLYCTSASTGWSVTTPLMLSFVLLMLKKNNNKS
jgi:hypothetical protein